MKYLSILMRSVAVGTLATISCLAAPIDLGISGNAQVGPNFINFGNYPTGTIYTPAPGYGTMQVSQTPTGIFAAQGVTAGETGMIQSLSAVNTPPGVVLTPDPATDPPFLTFDTTGSNLQVFLTELVPGSTTGPFSLLDSSNGAVAFFNINGFTFNTTDESRQDLTGTFSATFNGTTVAELLALEASGTNIMTPFSGTFSATIIPPVNVIPEPDTVLLLGGGLLAIGLLSRRGAKS